MQGNGNLDRYLGLLVDSVKRIENKLDKLADEHDDNRELLDNRLRTIEMKQATEEGAKKAVSSVWGAAGGAVSAFAAFIAQKYFG